MESMETLSNHEDEALSVDITVKRGNNLRGNKSDTFQYVRVEFNGAVVGDSGRKQGVFVDQSQSVEYDFTCSFSCPDDTHSLDDLAHKPVILTVMEVLPKEKKQKKERTAILGQAVVDLLPLLRGQCSISSTVSLHPAPGSPLETVFLDNSPQLPSLEVSVSLPRPMLSEAQLLGSNLLRVTVETAFSVPDGWSLPTKPHCTYVAALQLPLTAEKERVLMFSEGQLKAGGEREAADRPRRWPHASLLVPGAQVCPGASEEPLEEEYGEMTSVEDRAFCCEVETARSRVCWDTVRRCFLDAGETTRLEERIEECRLWPVEIMRSQPPVAQGGKVRKPDELAETDPQICFHGVAYVDLGPLLYPGGTRIRGSYRIHPFSEADLLAKTKRMVSVLKEQARAAAAQGKALGPGKVAAGASKVVDAANKAKESPRKLSVSSQGKPSGVDSVTDVEPTQMNVRQTYVDSRTYIVMDISLEKPLVSKRPPAELAKKVMELIPPRPLLPHCPAGAEKAVQAFHNQVASVVGQLLEQYQQLFGPAFQHGAEPLDPCTQDQHRGQLLGELNYSGKYFAFKEQMKSSVVRIVREKMLRTEAFSDPEQLHAFLSHLYVYLVDQMHLALNKTLSEDSQQVAVQPVLDVFQLRHFAREAELNGESQLASQYYQERLVREATEPSHWFDYGTLHMLTQDHLKAEECFHHAVSLQQSHLPSLVMCGVLAEMDGRHDEARTYLEGATCSEPCSVVAWTVLGLFHQGQDNHFQAEMCFRKAGRLLRDTPPERSPPCMGSEARQEGSQLEGQKDGDEEQELREGGLMEEQEVREGGLMEEQEVRPASIKPESAGQETERPSPPTPARGPGEAKRQTTAAPTHSIYMETAQFLLQNHALQMAQRSLAQDLLCSGGLSTSYCLATAKLQLLSGDYCSAAATLKEALMHTCKEPELWALQGHCSYLSQKLKEARQCYERSLDFQQEPADTHPIYLRLGSIYLQEGQFQSAKTTYLRACTSSPSCLTWLGLGIACYRLEDLREAEDALVEANTLNNRNPEVWGYLALISLKSGRRVEAEQSYKYAVKMKLQKESILREIKELQEQLGFGDPSF